ncbi:Sideroflexin-1 [Kappamyces sp. JEL0680]|nr:Sideroflexin-1 [Kappamyces sp. JEL0680]
MSETAANLDAPRWPQDTYLGRLYHFASITNPLNLVWAASDARLNSALQTVPIIALMLVPNPSMSLIVASQWINQSANVAFNYCNANKSAPMSTGETLTAYTAAVVSSCSIALGMDWWVKKKSPVPWRPLLSRAVPFVAVAAAGMQMLLTVGTLNVFLMRRKELVEGIKVQDEDGRVLGTSKTAGGHAISQVAISRIVTAAPALFVPGLIMSQLERTRLLRSRPWLGIPFNLLTVSGSLLVALPFAIALFPQMASLDVSRVEPEFAGLKRANGLPVQRVFFNRGL